MSAIASFSQFSDWNYIISSALYSLKVAFVLCTFQFLLNFVPYLGKKK